MNDISLLEVESHTAGHHALPLKHAVKLGNFRQAAGFELPQFGSGMHRLDTVLLQVLGQQTMERLDFLLGLQPTERQVMLHSLADILALILPERRQNILCRFTRQRDPGVQLGKLGIAQIGKGVEQGLVFFLFQQTYGWAEDSRLVMRCHIGINSLQNAHTSSGGVVRLPQDRAAVGTARMRNKGALSIPLLHGSRHDGHDGIVLVGDHQRGILKPARRMIV